MMLYRISRIGDTKLDKDGCVLFKPGFPDHVQEDLDAGIEPLENGNIPRISFSSSIEGCLMGLPSVGKFYNKKKEFENNCIYVYFIDDNKLDKNKIISNADLIKNDYVFDAAVTKEIWYLDPIKLKAHKFKIYKINMDKIVYMSRNCTDKIKPYLFDYLKSHFNVSDNYIKFLYDFSINDIVKYILYHSDNNDIRKWTYINFLMTKKYITSIDGQFLN